VSGRVSPLPSPFFLSGSPVYIRPCITLFVTVKLAWVIIYDCTDLFIDSHDGHVR
jgi:hypothetical protein